MRAMICQSRFDSVMRQTIGIRLLLRDLFATEETILSSFYQCDSAYSTLEIIIAIVLCGSQPVFVVSTAWWRKLVPS